ncbi:MAG: damage-inducible protein DinB [Rhodospirillaceae bacterium]|nr:damage-inducible protein DinB [Rhodospirillaceae bacterium]
MGMKAHFRRLAAYNRWANEKIYDAVGSLPARAFAAPRVGFFPSLARTLNHILVGDSFWMGRLDGSGTPPGLTRLDQILHEEFAALRAARAAMDQRIVAFVDGLSEQRIGETLVYKTTTGVAQETPVDQVLTHVFNHQTHHRGQAHAMLSSTEVAPPPLDLIYFLREHPEVARWR